MSEFDPIEYLTKVFKPGDFIAKDPIVGTNATGDRNIDLDDMVVAGLVLKHGNGYYMRPYGDLAKLADARLSKIKLLGSGMAELRLALPSAPRAYAFDVAADEMAYGDTCLVDPTRSDCSSKSHVEHLALIEHCCAEARRRFYEEPGQDGVGEQIRKMKALRACSTGQNPEVYVGASTNDRRPVGAAPGVHLAHPKSNTKTHIHLVRINLTTIDPHRSASLKPIGITTNNRARAVHPYTLIFLSVCMYWCSITAAHWGQGAPARRDPSKGPARQRLRRF